MTRTVNLGCQTGQALFNTAIKKKKTKNSQLLKKDFKQMYMSINKQTNKKKKKAK